MEEAAASAAQLEAAGVRTKIVAAEGAGHMATGAVAAETRGALDWGLKDGFVEEVHGRGRLLHEGG